MKTKLITMAVLAAVLVMSAAAPAAVIMNVTEVGSDVFAIAFGTVNLNGLTFSSAANYPTTELSSTAELLVGSGGTNVYAGISGPSSIGTGTSRLTATSTNGSGFGIRMDVGHFRVPYPYVSGSQINSSATWAGKSLSAMGLTEGTYIYTWGSGADADSLTINVGAVPEPATMALLGLGGLLIRRRKA